MYLIILQIQFKRMQANSSAKSILTDSKVHTQEMGRKIAALQKENTYLVVRDFANLQIILIKKCVEGASGYFIFGK